MAILPSPDSTPQIGVGDYFFKVEDHPAIFQAGENVIQNDAGVGLSPRYLETTPQQGHTSSHRTPQACDRCKSRKLKCDSSLNGCENCRAAGKSCYQTNKMTQKREQRGYWEELTHSNELLRNENERLKREVQHFSRHNAQLRDQLKVIQYQLNEGFDAMAHAGLPALPTIHGGGYCVPVPAADPTGSSDSNSMTLISCQVPGQLMPNLPHGLQQVHQYRGSIDAVASPYPAYSTESPGEEEQSSPYANNSLETFL